MRNRFFPSAHLSTPLFISCLHHPQSIPHKYISFLIAVRLGFMVNNRFFLPVQEFPLWPGCFDRWVRGGKAILYQERATPTVLFV